MRGIDELLRWSWRCGLVLLALACLLPAAAAEGAAGAMVLGSPSVNEGHATRCRSGDASLARTIEIPAPRGGWSGHPQAVNVINAVSGEVVIEHGTRRVCGTMLDARTLDSRFRAGVGTVLVPPAGDTRPIRVRLEAQVAPWRPVVRIGAPADVQREDTGRFVVRVAALAVISALALAALLSFIGTRETSFLSYVAYALLFAFWMALVCGLAGYPEPWIEMAGNSRRAIVGLGMLVVGGVFYVLCKFSGVERRLPRMRAPLRAAPSLAGVGAAGAFLLPDAALGPAAGALLCVFVASAGLAVLAGAVSMARGESRAVRAVVGGLPFLAIFGSVAAGSATARAYELELLVTAGTFMLLIAILGLQLRLGSLRRQRDAMRVLADTDPLTGVENRRAALARLEDLIAGCRAGGAGGSIAFVDIDHFKTINDRHGHHMGDRVLVEVASVLRAHVRVDDHVARMGGEEFLVVLPGVAPEVARARIAALCPAIGAAGQRLDPPVAVTASVGVAHVAPGVESVEALLRLADDAMYAAKRAGRNRIVEALPAEAAAG
ncbi:GGDEF domain-containing protein [Coralloluteibacterium stylophorae]|uniref:diguanylate cyclase n=1 Tax=Coralloluteibacterium stylophorae TaxID=1776034 RepID=A0AAP2C9V5_9GAMM|nr:diguanylate cyclase [Coralloluteibacterium stylophorae]